MYKPWQDNTPQEEDTEDDKNNLQGQQEAREIPYQLLKDPSLRVVKLVDLEEKDIFAVTNDSLDDISEDDDDGEIKGPSAVTLSGTFVSNDDPYSEEEEEPTFSGAFRWKAKSKRAKESGELVNAAENWGLIICAIHLATYLYYLFAVLFQIPWRNGLYGLPLIHETSLVRDHFGVVWSFSVLTLCQIFVPASVLWILTDLNSYPRKDLASPIIILQIFLSIFTLISLCIMLLGYCNTGVFRNVACDDDPAVYCKRWANDNPIGCPRDATADESILLKQNVVYDRWLVVLLVFFAIDVLIMFTINKLHSLAYFGHFRWDYGRYKENRGILYRTSDGRKRYY